LPGVPGAATVRSGDVLQAAGRLLACHTIAEADCRVASLRPNGHHVRALVVGDQAQSGTPAPVQTNTDAVFGFDVGLVGHLILMEGQGIAYIGE
jgi:hypothetical protein